MPLVIIRFRIVGYLHATYMCSTVRYIVVLREWKKQKKENMYKKCLLMALIRLAISNNPIGEGLVSSWMY
jgi:hypothetical protein